MEKRWAITYAALAGAVIVPYIFESFTFHLYTSRDPQFFTFSGARLWVFLISNVLLGFVVGTLKTRHPVILCAIAVAATCVLILLLYHLCEARQCYYPGPDGLGEFRLSALLISATVTGVIVGSVSRPLADRKAVTAVVFGCLGSIFVGFFPWALTFATYLSSELGLVMRAFASSAPFFYSGAVSRLFSKDLKHAIFSALAGWLVLTLLFVSLRPASVLLVFVILGCAIPSALAGFRVASFAMSYAKKERKTLALITGLFGFFILGAVHPFIDAPMSLTVMDDDDLMPKPTSYSVAYHYSENYYSTKRVEVEVNLTQFNIGSVGDFLFAGMGVQSPNCCKDGLDYGYRADLFFNQSGLFLAAWAWETCDINVACSGHPWASEMHQSIVRLPSDAHSETILLAMEWQPDGRTVKWYYGKSAAEWIEYSRFISPEIENPYFNLGVIPVGNPFTNPDTGNAFFFQVGVSEPGSASSALGSIGFHCPSYYDKDGIKQCVKLEPIGRGNSHWKALWKWGIQDPRTVTETDGSYAKITLT